MSHSNKTSLLSVQIHKDDNDNNGELTLLSAERLAAIFDPTDLKTFQSSMGGTEGIARMLRVDLDCGVETGRLETLRMRFKSNKMPSQPPISLWKLVWLACQDRTLALLSVAAAISLAVGIYNDYQMGTFLGWIEGVAILTAVLTVILVNALNDWHREGQFRRLSAKNDESKQITVIRDGGRQHSYGTGEIVVGDVVCLGPGDVIPADGTIIDGQLKVDESSATGESDSVQKDGQQDPFLLSSSKVLDGTGRMLVLAVGLHSFYGRMIAAMNRSGRQDGIQQLTPLQHKLDNLAEKIAYWGLAAAVLLFAALVIKFCILAALYNGWPPASVTVQQILHFLIEAITVVVVAVPEGLPMAVTLALAYATTRMLADNNLVRVLSACETMGSATCICSDKTGTLTENRMTVVRAAFFTAHQGKILWSREAEADGVPNAQLIAQGIAINSTAYQEEGGGSGGGGSSFVGSKTEAALLGFLPKLGPFDWEEIRRKARILKVFPFSSERKLMATVVQGEEEMPVVHLKGAAEIVLSACENATNVEAIIDSMARDGLRTISLAYKRLERTQQFGDLNEILHGFQLLAVVGIEDPLREGVIEAVETCQRAGIFVRMVTGDNLATAETIARRCGILQRGGLAMEGVRFRGLGESQRDALIPKLQVLARSSPLDKQILVDDLRLRHGEIVAVTGDGTNDGPALRAAHVGFAMGLTGTEVAKEASSIILLDDNFSSILRAVSWGRAVGEAVRKFLRFQLTVNVAAVATCFGTAILDPREESVLSALQLLWVNLLMDVGAALALATGRPTSHLLERHADPPETPLVTAPMWKVIVGHAVWQTSTILFLRFQGARWLLGLDVQEDRALLFTLLFNLFVWHQLVNEINAKGRGEVHWLFVAIWLGSAIVQTVLVYFGGEVFGTVPLPPHLLSISVGVALLGFPVEWILRALPFAREHVDPARRRVFLSRERLQWQEAVGTVQRGLAVFSALRRARDNSNSLV